MRGNRGALCTRGLSLRDRYRIHQWGEGRQKKGRLEGGLGLISHGAGNGIRTRDINLGKVALYH